MSLMGRAGGKEKGGSAAMSWCHSMALVQPLLELWKVQITPCMLYTRLRYVKRGMIYAFAYIEHLNDM